MTVWKITWNVQIDPNIGHIFREWFSDSGQFHYIIPNNSIIFLQFSCDFFSSLASVVQNWITPEWKCSFHHNRQCVYKMPTVDLIFNTLQINTTGIAMFDADCKIAFRMYRINKTRFRMHQNRFTASCIGKYFAIGPKSLTCILRWKQLTFFIS